MESLPDIITAILGAGAVFTLAAWLMKRLIVKQDEKLDQIIEKLDSLRVELYQKYITKAEVDERLSRLKEDLRREMGLVVQAALARASSDSGDA